MPQTIEIQRAKTGGSAEMIPFGDVLPSMDRPGTIDTSRMASSRLSARVLLDNPLERRFHSLVAEWKAERGVTGTARRMTMLEPYLRIVLMGREKPAEVISLLLAELQTARDHWFWALEAITGEDPVPSDVRGKLPLMAEAWIEWGRARGYAS